MKKNILALLIIFLSCGTLSAQTLKQYRDNAAEKMFDLKFNTAYANALKANRKGNEKELATVANNLAMLTAFSWFQNNFSDMEQKGMPHQEPNSKSVLAANYPLTILHKAELQYTVAADAKDYNTMRKALASALAQPLPQDNMVDRINVGGMLSMLIDFGSEAQAKDYKAYLENFIKTSKNSAMVDMAKATVKDITGFIMIKEWEAKHPDK